MKIKEKINPTPVTTPPTDKPEKPVKQKDSFILLSVNLHGVEKFGLAKLENGEAIGEKVCDTICDQICDGVVCDNIVCDGVICDAICDSIVCDSVVCDNNVCDSICGSVCDKICGGICDSIVE